MTALFDTQKLKHFHCAVDGNQIVWITFDMADSHVNTLNQATLSELRLIVDMLKEKQTELNAMIVISQKSGFIMGADVNAIETITTAEEAERLILEGRAIFDDIANLSMTTVAMIDGLCLGGGLELALACDYRFACDDSNTKLAFPEVLLGIYPGWGGSVRSVRLMGVLNAMDLMLTGRFISAKRAQKIRLIDRAVPERHLKTAAIEVALKPFSKKVLPIWLRLLNQPLFRSMIGKMLKKKVTSKVRSDHYPAPFALIDAWVSQGVDDNAFAIEAKTVAKLVVSDTTRELIRVFHLREQLKQLTKTECEPIKHVHVIGAGTMGGDIAATCALSGFTVTLNDLSLDMIATAINRATNLFDRKLNDKRLSQQAMDRLIPDHLGHGVKQADLIIEAIVENVDVKCQLFRDMAAQLSPHTIVATNTSSIALNELIDALPHAKQFIGLHFFNPVPLMPLVEVVASDHTSKRVLDRAFHFVGQLNKLPLPVKSVTGFLVNRVLMPYLLTSVTLLKEGHRAEVIDQSARDFGMPMGPIELADKVGLDVCLAVGNILIQRYGGEIPEKLQQLVDQKQLGQKSKHGFYRYKNGKIEKTGKAKGEPDLAERLINVIIAESQKALSERVVDSANLIDAGMIFGIGFAPFRGGPLHYSKRFNKQP